jgi:precorrin-2 dehydrogenase/sirohydrochlorin ferrochelatase
MIYEKAKSMGVLINDATNASRSDVHVPFESEVEGIRVAISSEGASGVSAHVAQYIVERCLKNCTFWKNINVFAKSFKSKLKELVDDPKDRYHLYWFVMLQPEVVKRIKEGSVEEALEQALQLAVINRGIRDYSPQFAMPHFLDMWGDELLRSCCAPFEGRSK